jgi:predicted DNA-binding transcriptional regulator YafY
MRAMQIVDTRLALSRPPLERMALIHGELLAGKYPNSQTLAQMLEVSPKSIQRDIDFMRDRLRLPIEYDPRAWGFYYTTQMGPATPAFVLTRMPR